MRATEMPHAPSAALNTSEGARRFIADFFATELRRHDFTDYISTRLAADFACALAQHLAATGKQQVGEAAPATFDDGGDYYADQHGDGAWATYLRNGKGWVYNFGHGDDAEIRAKSVARELNRQVASITARMQVGEVQGDALNVEQLQELVSRIHSTVSLGHQTGPHAYAGEDFGCYLAEAAGDCQQIMRALTALAARQPGAQERVAWASTGATGHKVVAMPGLHKLPYGDYDLYAAPPAQGIDLGQQRPLIARALAEWHEDDGNVMWWAWCGRGWAGEAAWCGTPNDSDWPGYHTHWTQHPDQPALIDQRDAAPGVGNG